MRVKAAEYIRGKLNGAADSLFPELTSCINMARLVNVAMEERFCWESSVQLKPAEYTDAGQSYNVFSYHRDVTSGLLVRGIMSYSLYPTGNSESNV